MTQSSDIIRVLEQISSTSTEMVKYVNKGGCAVFATLVARRLSKYVPVKILVQNWGSNNNNIDDIREAYGSSNLRGLQDWNDAGVSFRHVVIKVMIDNEWQVFDSKGLQPFIEDVYYQGDLTIEEIANVAGVDYGWNDMFDRRQILKLARIIHNEFKNLVAIH